MKRTLEEYIAGLSKEEKEEHRELIEESLRRHRELKESMNQIRSDLAVLNESWGELQYQMNALIESVHRLNTGILDVYSIVRSEEFSRLFDVASGPRITTN